LQEEYSTAVFGGIAVRRTLTGLMVMTVVLLFLTGCPDMFDKDKEIAFEDPNLETAVRETIGKHDGPLYESDVQGITQLVARERSIESLEGIQYLRSLQELNLGSPGGSDTPNKISDISRLAALHQLKKLNLNSNKVEDISALANLPDLEELRMWFNKVSDISALSGLAKLRILDLGDNGVQSISALSGLTNLERLSFSGEVSDLTPLAGHEKLTLLWFYKNKVTDISALSGLEALISISFWQNLVTSISPLAELENIQELDFSFNYVDDITVLVDNEDINDGDFIDMRENYLDIARESQDRQNIELLEGRGVTVLFSPQRVPAASVEEIGLVCDSGFCKTRAIEDKFLGKPIP